VDLSTLRRRVKRQFGDEYGTIINDQDILDWCNEGQDNIIRDTSSNDVTVTALANQFPLTLTDRVAIKRLTVNNRPLKSISIEDLDSVSADATVNGTPSFWYRTSESIRLYPDPAPSDVFNVLVTYAPTPVDLHLLSPYLQFSLQPLAGTVQYAQTAGDIAFRKASLNAIFDFEIVNINLPFLLAASGTSDSAFAQLSWAFYYMGNNDFRLITSNNAAVVTRNLTLTGGTLTAGRLRMRVVYDGTTGTLTFYRIDLTTGVETISGTVVGTVATLNTTTTLPISIGALGTLVGSQIGPFKLYEFQYSGNPSVGFYEPILILDGEADIQDIPTEEATTFGSTSGHTWTIGGNPSILTINENQLTVPEVYHEDLVTYCLSRAFDKNMNYKAAGENMEKFQQNTSQRRDIADSDDIPNYKGVDPFDHDVFDYSGWN